MKVGSKAAVCTSCSYEYSAKKGDDDYPITPGTPFTVRLQAAVLCAQPASHVQWA